MEERKYNHNNQHYRSARHHRRSNAISRIQYVPSPSRQYPQYGRHYNHQDHPSSYHRHRHYGNTHHRYASNYNHQHNHRQARRKPNIRYPNHNGNNIKSYSNRNNNRYDRALRALCNPSKLNEWISNQNQQQQSILYDTIGLKFDVSWERSSHWNCGWPKGESFEQEFKRVMFALVAI